MRANLTPYITKIQEISGASLLGPHQHWTHWEPKGGPRKKSTHNQNSWIPPCNICDPYEVYQKKHKMAISVWFFFFLELSHLHVGLSRPRFKHPTIRERNERSNPPQNTLDPWSFENGFWCNYAFFKRSHSLKYYSVMWPPITV